MESYTQLKPKKAEYHGKKKERTSEMSRKNVQTGQTLMQLYQ